MVWWKENVFRENYFPIENCKWRLVLFVWFNGILGKIGGVDDGTVEGWRTTYLEENVCKGDGKPFIPKFSILFSWSNQTMENGKNSFTG